MSDWHGGYDEGFRAGWDERSGIVKLVRVHAAARKRMSAWQPIETAPKDGSAFLAVVDQFIYTCIWHRARHCWTDGGPAYMTIPHDEQPTRWQPLPDPPEPAP